MTPVEQARSLAQRGNLAGAIQALRQGADVDDADCLVDLAFIYLQAIGVPRDLAKSRECFARAGQLGHAGAREIHTAFLAAGIGGDRDFRQALEQLRIAAAGDARAARELALIEKMAIDDEGDPLRVPEPEALSEIPRVWMFRQLLDPEECRFLIDAAQPAFRPAHVGSAATGEQAYSNVRTCDFAAFSWVAESPAIHAINRRIAAASNSAVEWGEPLQILRYAPGQEFKPHRDCTERTDNQRVLTLLVYLNDAYTGGETHFLHSGLKVRGEVGDAILFRNADEQGNPDPASLHSGLPVISGMKLLASRWIRQKPFGPRN